LERSFFFVHKPPTHIRFDEISSVDFLRVSDDSTNHTFDLGVNLTNDLELIFLKAIKKMQNWPKAKPPYLQFVLYKENTDTIAALDALAKAIGVRPGMFTTACMLLFFFLFRTRKVRVSV